MGDDLTSDPKLLAERNAKLEALGPMPPWWRPFARRRWRDERARILAIDVSRLAAILRAHYTPAYMQWLANRPSPLQAMYKQRYADIERDESSEGFSYTRPVRIVSVFCTKCDETHSIVSSNDGRDVPECAPGAWVR